MHAGCGPRLAVTLCQGYWAGWFLSVEKTTAFIEILNFEFL